MISALRIAEGRSLAAMPVEVEVVAETGSTNTDLLGRVATLDAPLLLVAEAQTQGRGRVGRTWLSAPGAALTFSLAWRLAKPVGELSGLPLAIGVAVAQALGEYDVPVALKWPNDILKDGRKLGGILIETAGTPGGTWAVIGIGLNLTLPDELEAQIGQPAAEARWLAQADRSVLLAALLNSLSEALVQFEREGFAPFAERWNRRHAHAGKAVVITQEGQSRVEGVAVGVDGWGRLLIDSTTGRLAINAGDVSLRIRHE